MWESCNSNCAEEEKTQIVTNIIKKNHCDKTQISMWEKIETTIVKRKEKLLQNIKTQIATKLNWNSKILKNSNWYKT